jgi:hypothetical protein
MKCRRLCRHSLQARAQGGSGAGALTVEQIPQVSPERSEDRFRTGVVLPTDELSGQRFQVIEERGINLLRGH